MITITRHIIALSLLSLAIYFLPIDAINDKFVRKSVRDVWFNHSHPHILHKYVEYADHYDKFLPSPKEGQTIKLFEIGVQSGGSIRAWKEYYGNHATIVGVDIDPRCKRSENITENIFIEIGSQMDEVFLKKICEKYGPFDVIIDDGGHTDKMILISAFFLFPNDNCLNKDSGVYFIEDLHTMVIKHYMARHSAITEKLIGTAFESMHYHWNKNFYRPQFSDKLAAVHLYNSMIIFEKRVLVRNIEEFKRGTDFFSNDEDKINPEGTYNPWK